MKKLAMVGFIPGKKTKKQAYTRYLSERIIDFEYSRKIMLKESIVVKDGDSAQCCIYSGVTTHFKRK